MSFASAGQIVSPNRDYFAFVINEKPHVPRTWGNEQLLKECRAVRLHGLDCSSVTWLQCFRGIITLADMLRHLIILPLELADQLVDDDSEQMNLACEFFNGRR